MTPSIPTWLHRHTWQQERTILTATRQHTTWIPAAREAGAHQADVEAEQTPHNAAGSHQHGRLTSVQQPSCLPKLCTVTDQLGAVLVGTISTVARMLHCPKIQTHHPAAVTQPGHSTNQKKICAMPGVPRLIHIQAPHSCHTTLINCYAGVHSQMLPLHQFMHL